MSFETWSQSEVEVSLYNAFQAGRAERDAEIAALQADLTKAVRLAADYGIERDKLLALFSDYEFACPDFETAARVWADMRRKQEATEAERDKLWEWLSQEVHINPAWSPEQRKALQSVLFRLSTPASVETARKS